MKNERLRIIEPHLDLTEQITTIESKFNKKLEEYVNLDELIREDQNDIFARVDQENHILLFEFEDTIINGIIVYRIFAKTESAQRTRRLYI